MIHVQHDQPVISPRSCVKVFDIGMGKRMLLSYDERGSIVEHWSGPIERCTDERQSEMESYLAEKRKSLTLV